MARLRDHRLSEAMLELASLFTSLKVKALVIWFCSIDGLLFSAFLPAVIILYGFDFFVFNPSIDDSNQLCEKTY